MNTDRIEEIQKEMTIYPDSISVQQALLQVWNECKQEQANMGCINCEYYFKGTCSTGVFKGLDEQVVTDVGLRCKYGKFKQLKRHK